jgi:hypothetical protein
MVLPTDDECRRVIEALDGEPNLTEWEYEFVQSNLGRRSFSATQKESVARLMEKFEVE